MKENRQSRIMELIGQQSIETQEELMNCLQKEGFAVTQATVSRDIRELKLVKSMSEEGKYRYALPKREIQDGQHIYHNALASSVVSIDYALNNIVIKTYVGMAQTVAVAIDSLQEDSILGCVAGDDTIILVTRSEESAKNVTSWLRNNIRK